MEDLEQKALEYQSAADAMQIQTEEVKTLVRNSEEETEKVRLEKMSIMQKWTSAVINLGKRDEALENFRCALKNQQLALKSVKVICFVYVLSWAMTRHALAPSCACAVEQ